MEVSLFDDVGDALRGIAPANLGPVRQQPRKYGIKVWYGGDQPPKLHYEAQVIGASAVDDAKVLALEVGFHAEHPQAVENDAILATLVAGEKKWRKLLGADVVAGPFLGRAQTWRRVSETWADPDLSDPELSFEVAARLADYLTALEPILRAAQ